MHIFILLLLCIPVKGLTTVYRLPDTNSKLIGEPVKYLVEKGDFFHGLTEYHNVGYRALLAANPNISPKLLRANTTLDIPKQMLLPFAERKGIVINLAELRLFYYPPGEDLVYVFPVGIGRQGLSTPKLISYIGDKRKDPDWQPPQATRERYYKKHGRELAKIIPAGPNNPFGKYALRLGTSELLIHGTNNSKSIGTRASAGCIRMYAHDIEWLYQNISLGTQVRIVDQPIKMSYEPNGRKLIEVHQPLNKTDGMELLKPVIEQFIGINNQKARQLLKSTTGLVQVVSAI